MTATEFTDAQREHLARIEQAEAAEAWERRVETAARLTITNGWLVEEVEEHTCGTGRDGHYGHHEPGCGEIPVMEVVELVALFDALTALGIPINRGPEELPKLAAAALTANAEGQGGDEEREGGCGHPNHGALDHDCRFFYAATPTLPASDGQQRADDTAAVERGARPVRCYCGDC